MVLLEGGQSVPVEGRRFVPVSFPLFSKVRRIQCGLFYRLRRNQSGLIEMGTSDRREGSRWETREGARMNLLGIDLHSDRLVIEKLTLDGQ